MIDHAQYSTRESGRSNPPGAAPTWHTKGLRKSIRRVEPLVSRVIAAGKKNKGSRRGEGAATYDGGGNKRWE
uniref:Uncharacterized protein n=1 Tax=uncultured Armatimonadetes bacterium TaxID=157466 RepID=A0A6J4I4S2_9BACT|nr:hypothetical protein AVDCRST_MAG63-1456 [uncultured Armatimonadetes bacterium]